MSTVVRRSVLTTCVALAAVLAVRSGIARERGTFASQIERLSEPEGAFDTDNLISNERSYLHVVPSIVASGVTGGAYIGVGPDQNFSYIPRLKPSIAYIIDIRRDNLLLHLLFKALFARSSTRITYLSLLTGRAPPTDLARWKTASIRDIAAYVDSETPSQTAVTELERQLAPVLTGFGVKLSATDLRTIDRFHRAFIEDGLGLQFHSFGRAPQFYYPTFRDLLMGTDARGKLWNYLAAENDFQLLKSMEADNLIVPLVGDIAGGHAMRAIGEDMTEHGTKLSAMYVSNIESYLLREGSFPKFVENVNRLPRDERSLIIRSVFAGGGTSTSSIEPIDRLFTSSPPPGRYR